jgi:signal transduction histidine kinase
MKLFAIVFCFLLATKTHAQTNATLDSLLKTLDTEKQDSNILKSLGRISEYYTDNNPSKAIGYLERAVQLAKKINKPLRLANAYYSLGFCYLLKADFNKSLDHYQQSATIYEQLNDKRRLINAYMSIGNVFFKTKDLNKSTNYYDKAEALVIQTKDTIQLSSIYSERAIKYDEQGNFDSALFFYSKAMSLAKAINNDYLINNLLSNIGLTYKHKKNTALALQYFDTVLKNFEQSTDKPLDYIAGMYNNIAATHAQAGNYQKAELAFNKSIDYAKQGHMANIEMENYKNMAEMFGKMNDYKLEANYLKKYYNLKDSFFNTDNKNQLTQLEADYQVEKKNASLVKQEAETSKQKNQRNIFILIAIGAGILLTGLSFFYSKIKKQNALLQQQNEQINKQKNELQTLNHVKDRLFSIISHDLRNPLVTLKSYLTLSDNPNLTEEKKEAFKKQTNQAVSQTSSMLDNLLVWANMQIKNTNPAITTIELEDCIDDAIGAARAQATQKNISFTKNIEVANAASDFTILEIALRNIVTNAVKYSNANSEIKISTNATNDYTFISIKDEGVGMSKEKIEELLHTDIESTTGTQGEKGSGLGLFLVKELLQKINANLVIESEVGKGSNFIIQLPA